MAGPERGGDVARQLDELKRRSGRSYEQIAVRTFLSRSTVHRYCSGQGTPQNFGAVEAIATACGATAAELARLHRCWERARRARAAEPVPRAARGGAEPGAVSTAVAEPPEVVGALDVAEPPDVAGPSNVVGPPEIVEPLEVVGPSGGPKVVGMPGVEPLEVAGPPDVAGPLGVAGPPGSTGSPGGELPGGAGRPGSAAPSTGSGSAALLRPPPTAPPRRGLVPARPDLAEPAPAPAGGSPGRGRRWWLPVSAVAACLALVLLAYSLRAGSGPRPLSGLPPNWTDVPAEIDPDFVGVTLNSATGDMPGFPVDSVRLWDSGTRWQALEPERGRYDWRTLDRLLDSARQAGVSVVFTFGGTPGWASPRGQRSAYPDDSRNGPPDDLADWERFVTAVVTRAAGRVEAYELWDFGPPNFDGSVETLVEMTEIGGRVVRELDPRAQVVCPGFGELWDPVADAHLERFAVLRGYDHCDAAPVKLHPRRMGDPPESMAELATRIEATLHRGGARPRMWNTGVSVDNPYEPAVPAELAADFAVRWYLMGLWLEYDRVYFYSWGGGKVPIPLQVAGFQPTEAGRYVGELREWLRGARISSCGRGGEALLPDNVWQCRFDRGGKAFVVRWTHEGTAEMAPDPGMAVVQRLDGSRDRLRSGERLEVTGSPVLLRAG
ncbi:helix-turn-helix domain-containing protein [Saccharopolyspora sp. NPDC047091]|uniref:helix-turn-helix domain-containing protein n=1 Tax=Saccharopolyspora sp. NPDC047091 TaxID=3155924 RepID=UPI0033C24A8B